MRTSPARPSKTASQSSSRKERGHGASDFRSDFRGLSGKSVLCGFPDEEAVLKVVETIRQKLDEIEHLHQRLKDMDGQW